MNKQNIVVDTKKYSHSYKGRLTHATIRMSRENILTEIRQSQKDKYYMSPKMLR